MISKQGFLNTIKDEIFPILQGHQDKTEQFRKRVTKRLPLISLFLVILFIGLSFFLMMKQILYLSPSVLFFLFLLGIVPSIWGFISFSCYCKKIENDLKPKVFALLGLDENSDEDLLEELSDTGVLPYFNEEMIDDSFAVRGSLHSLFIQEIDLEKSSGKHSTHIFSGIIIAAKQLHPKNFSLLILDSQNRKNRSPRELTNKLFSKLSGVHFQWQRVEDKFLENNFSFYTDNPELCAKCLTPAFESVVEKLKAGDGEPLNILFHNGKIFLVVATKRDFFECINWKNFSDTEPYEQLYDDIQSLYQVDELLSELERIA